MYIYIYYLKNKYKYIYTYIYICIYKIIIPYYIIIVGHQIQKKKDACEVTTLKCAHPPGTEYSRTL